MGKITNIFGGLKDRRFIIAFGGCFATILAFDVLWSLTTTFRGMSFAGTYIYGVLLALLLAAPSVWMRRSWLQTVVLLLVDGLAIANLMYCRTYFSSIPPASYLLAGNVMEFGDAILQSLRWSDVLFPVITIVTIIGLHFTGRRDAGCGVPEKARSRGYLAALGVMAVAAGVYGLCVGSPLRHIEWLKNECYYRTTPPVIYTLPGAFVADLMQSSVTVSEAEKQEALRVLGESVEMRRNGGVEVYADSSSVPRNIVMIIVESLEAWPIGAKVEGHEITPCLNRLVADTARTFFARRVLSQVGPGRSIDGQLLMTAGLMPIPEYVYSMRFPDNNYPHLGKMMKQQRGTRNYFLSGDRPTTWNQGVMVMNFGFDVMHFRDDWDCSESFTHPTNPSDGSFATQVIDRMRSGEIWPEGESAFLEILTYSSHAPFTIPEEFRRLNLKEQYPAPLGDYIMSINYTDATVGRLVDYIMSRPDAERTMIVIAGDHEGISGWRRDLRNDARFAGLVDDEGYVPLIVVNAPQPGRRDVVMGQTDVYPTLIDMAGLKPSADSLDSRAFPGLGISALNTLSPKYALDPSGRIVGDTVGINPQVLEHIKKAPRASSAIIRANLLR